MTAVYQDVLTAAGFPTTAIILDFETYFTKKYTLKGEHKVSTVEYVMDPRFEVTGLGHRTVGEPELWFANGWERDTAMDSVPVMVASLQANYGENLEDCTIVGNNLYFDALVLKEHFGIVPAYTVDNIDLDRMWDARRPHKLELMAPNWKLKQAKGDTEQFLGYHAADMSPEMRANLEVYCKNDVDLEHDLFIKMMECVVSRPEIELPVAAHTLRMFLNTGFDIDVKLCDQLQTRMQIEMAKAVSAAGEVLGYDCGHDDISRPSIFVPAFTEILEARGCKLPLKLSDKPHKKTGKHELIPALAKNDQEMQELLCHPDYAISTMAQAKVAVASWPTHIAKVRNIALQARARNDEIGAPLKYHSAHSARWGGGEKLNPQNMGGRGRAGVGTHPLIARVRNTYRAKPGHSLGILDWASIEARKLAWFAGQEDLLEGFRHGHDIYSVFAKELFQRDVWKWDRDEIEREKHCCPAFMPEDEFQELKRIVQLCRGFGKDAILGCGYGMGWETFYGNCYVNPALRPYFDDGTYDEAFIQKLIKLYRSKYKMIPKFWRDVEKAWRYVTKFPSKHRVVNNLTFWSHKKATYITLPSGRDFRYPNAKVNRKDGSLSFKYGKIYGGAITENVCQASARDLLAESILNLDAAGIEVILHAHDENVLSLPIETAAEELERAADIMEQVPDWAAGLPIAIGREGGIRGELSQCYKK